jgi:hypothetical protein
MKKILLIYPKGPAAGCLDPVRLAPALEAAGAAVQVCAARDGDGHVPDALSEGTLPVVIKAFRRDPKEPAGTH